MNNIKIYLYLISFSIIIIYLYVFTVTFHLEKPTIHIIDGQLNQNCPENLNKDFIANVKKICEGLGTCQFNVNENIALTNSCSPDPKITWSCQKESFIKVIYHTNQRKYDNKNISYVSLGCPGRYFIPPDIFK